MKVVPIFIKSFILTLISLSLYAQSSIKPVPNAIYNSLRAELGKKLFFEPMISKDGTISCASCHNLPGNGANSIQYSFGVDTQEGLINTPTVLNATFNFVQHFNGQAKTLQEQVLLPITNPLKMATTIKMVLSKLKNSKYKDEFERIYPDGLNEKNFANAISEFEKALTTPNSKFDQFLRGETHLSRQELLGYKQFKSTGCINCHNGVNIGGGMYQKMGIFIKYKEAKKLNGRIDITKRERDKNVYKVPTLRNIAITAPYFHDGKIVTLKQAIRKMREHQLGITLRSKSIENIEAFLKTLTGETPKILQGMK